MTIGYIWLLYLIPLHFFFDVESSILLQLSWKHVHKVYICIKCNLTKKLVSPTSIHAPYPVIQLKFEDKKRKKSYRTILTLSKRRGVSGNCANLQTKNREMKDTDGAYP